MRLRGDWLYEKRPKRRAFAMVVQAPRDLSRFVRSAASLGQARKDLLQRLRRVAAIMRARCDPSPLLQQAATLEFHYVGCFAAVIFGVLLLLSLRLAFSALAAALLVGGLSSLSRLKFKYLRMNLHAYDFVHFLGDRTAIAVVLTDLSAGRTPLTPFAAVILLSVVGLAEPVDVGWTAATAILLTTVAAFAAARRYYRPAARHSDHWGYFKQPVNLHYFVDSIFDAFKACCSGGVLATAPVEKGAIAWPSAPASERPRPAPNIVLVLNESTFPPWLHQRIPDDPALSAFFRSANGRSHGLRVETFGGATWRTEFSVLTGIPAGSYGPFSAHVFHWATNKIRWSLAQYLQQLQYRTVMVNPLPNDFINSVRFYHSIGIDETIDPAVHGAPSWREADEFYLGRGLDWLERHFSTGDRPAFLYVMTMSNHSPHGFQFVDARGRRIKSRISDDEFDEYMRRLHRTVADYADFRASLARRFPDREFLIVRFGDHQPSFTLRYFDRAVAWRAAPARTVEPLYRTYFAVDGVNFDPNIDRDLPETIEPAYLGAVLLRAAGIPLDAAHALRHDLMIRHAGRLYFADDDGKIAAQHNRRMIEAGLVIPH